MVSTGVVDSKLNQFYDIFSTLALIANLVCAFAITFDSVEARFGTLLQVVDEITVFFFAVDYVLRLITAEEQYKGEPAGKAAVKYATSGYGIIDLLSFLPHYLPMFFPAGAAVFRMFRVVRIFRLFRINAQYDSFNVIKSVLVEKRNQIASSVFIIIILMMASSLGIYSAEHNAQPEAFKNAFSGIWWSVSTLLTVGYGDIYPVTVVGKIMAIFIAFLGVGVVAIPTGIISAGFVEHYTKKQHDHEKLPDIREVGEVLVEENSQFEGLSPDDLEDIYMVRLIVVLRDGLTILPSGELRIRQGDILVVNSERLEKKKQRH